MKKDHPFEYGAVYRVRAAFTAPRDSFRAGEILVYWRFAQSVYDGMQGYFFRIPGSGNVRPWDMSLGADTRCWSELFERTADPAPVITAALAGDAQAAVAAVPVDATELSDLSIELAMQAAAEGGSAAVVRSLLSRVTDPMGLAGRVLHTAAGAGHADVVRSLLDAGAVVDEADAVGQTPLIHASTSGDAETVALLLSRGADPGTATSGGVTARALAASRHHAEVVALLDAALEAPIR